jgi:GAF domain-containing protein
VTTVDSDLESSLTQLADVVLRHQPLEATLIEVAAFATSAIPGADGTGLTLLEHARADTMVASADFVRVVDEVQYRVGEGPCLLAVETGATQMSGSLGGEARWPRFGPRAGRMGVHSALSMPLLVGEQVIGALSVYGHARDAFGARSVRIGELFSRPAAVTVANALLLEESRRLTEQLGRALGSRAVIDQAIGILMSRGGIGDAEAFETLKRMSQSSGNRVADVARQLVDQAVGRARERRATADPDSRGGEPALST